ncbi:MAG TPA: SH3 domain-containing protein [Verrucomicrobiae bacterium]|nr:SH3 domain-containing protein [Verrucomicrobiae bacterium]
MKIKCWLVLGLMLSTSLLAQPGTNPPPIGLPAPGTTNVTAPAAKSAKKKAAARPAKKQAPAETKSAIAEKPIVLSPGPATITGGNVNVRGQARLNSEIVKRLNKGDAVTVIEQIILGKPKADEPSQWAKINFPAEAHVWVHSSYIDSTNKVVLPKKLNVRTGAGENYSVVGLIERGTAVKEVSKKGDWIEIEAPAGAYAFVAAQYLKQEATPAIPPIISFATPPTEPKPTPTTVPEAQAVAAPPTASPTTTPATTPAPAVTPETAPAPPAFVEEPPPPRVVAHEGVVKSTRSIQAPTKFAIVDPDSGKTVNYLYTTSTNLDLQWWKGHRVIVTGEEGLDRRWTNTPVITIQRIQVVD